MHFYSYASIHWFRKARFFVDFQERSSGGLPYKLTFTSEKKKKSTAGLYRIQRLYRIYWHFGHFSTTTPFTVFYLLKYSIACYSRDVLNRCWSVLVSTVDLWAPRCRWQSIVRCVNPVLLALYFLVRLNKKVHFVFLCSKITISTTTKFTKTLLLELHRCKRLR